MDAIFLDDNQLSLNSTLVRLKTSAILKFNEFYITDNYLYFKARIKASANPVCFIDLGIRHQTLPNSNCDLIGGVRVLKDLFDNETHNMTLFVLSGVYDREADKAIKKLRGDILYLLKTDYQIDEKINEYLRYKKGFLL